MLKLGVGSRTIMVGGGGDAISLVGFEPSRVLQTSTIELFEFDDGTIFTVYDLLALGFDIPGTDANDVLVGSSMDDRLIGLDGNDILNGDVGNDQLAGGDGDDSMSGGRGR